MGFQELGIHNQQPDDELSVWPKSALRHKKAAVTLMDQTCGPGFRSPCRIQIFFKEESQLVGIRHGDDLHVAALVVRFHAVILEPVAQSYILRVAEWGGGDALAVDI